MSWVERPEVTGGPGDVRQRADRQEARARQRISCRSDRWSAGRHGREDHQRGGESHHPARESGADACGRTRSTPDCGAPSSSPTPEGASRQAHVRRSELRGRIPSSARLMPVSPTGASHSSSRVSTSRDLGLVPSARIRPGAPSSIRGVVSARDLAVSLEGLRKNYGELEAVRDVRFKVERGEIFAILGPNGAGKTTAMRSSRDSGAATRVDSRSLASTPRGGREGCASDSASSSRRAPSSRTCDAESCDFPGPVR